MYDDPKLYIKHAASALEAAEGLDFDMDILVGNQRFRVHSCFLPDYINRNYSRRHDEGFKFNAILKETTPQAMTYLLRCLYRGHINVEQVSIEDVLDLLHLAHQLCLATLVNDVFKSVLPKINDTNFFETIAYLRRKNMAFLVKQCWPCFIPHAKGILDAGKWLKEPVEIFRGMLANGRQLFTAKGTVAATLSWLVHNPSIDGTQLKFIKDGFNMMMDHYKARRPNEYEMVSELVELDVVDAIVEDLQRHPDQREDYVKMPINHKLFLRE